MMEQPETRREPYEGLHGITAPETHRGGFPAAPSLIVHTVDLDAIFFCSR